MSNKLTFEDIIAAKDYDVKEVHVPEWGGTVTVGGMTKREQQQLRKQATDTGGKIDADRLEVMMLVHCIKDPKLTLEQAEQLVDKSATAVDKVLAAILDVTGLSEAAQKAAEATFR